MCCTIADHVMIIILFCYENILFQTLILHMKNFYMNVYSIWCYLWEIYDRIFFKIISEQINLNKQNSWNNRSKRTKSTNTL